MLIIKGVDGGQPFDFGKTSENYALYRDVYPDVFFETLHDLGIGRKGQNVLDLGTGTGVLPRSMYKFGAHFCGVDVSAKQIEQAKILSAGMDIEYIVSASEEIDFPESSFDAATALQCAGYFNRDKLYPKLKHILKENGLYAEMSMIHLPRESEIAAKTEQLMLKCNPHWSGSNNGRDIYEITPRRYIELAGEVFTLHETRLIEAQIPFTRETWHGIMKTYRAIGASYISKQRIEEWEREHKAFLTTQPETFTIPHLIQIVVMRATDKDI